MKVFNLCFRRTLIVVMVLTTVLMLSQSLFAASKFYNQHNLVSDGFVTADQTDSNLVNAWGLVFNPFGFVWISDNGTGFSTLYDGNGTPQSLVVTIPPAAGSTDAGNPTGIVYNGSSDFIITKDTLSGSSRFIFASENGTIAAWAPNVDSLNAILVVDNSATGAVYKGLALAANGTDNFLYATDFHNSKIDVFDKNFAPATLACSFSYPKMPSGFGPFGIQNLNGNIYVTYAKQDADKHDDVAGKGLGFVNVFDANGCLIKRVATKGKLNSPWGLAIAPANFGVFSNRLLVGNFGDGTINAFDIATGASKGQMKKPDGHVLVIDGLWGLSFGNGLQNQPTNALFFTAGPGGENYGLYGRIEAAP
jgi:uncharacterized protein (TIGR03118 family)